MTLLVLASLLLAVLLRSVPDPSDDAAVRFDPAHAPSPSPDRITLTWSDEETSTSQAITWRTDASVPTGLVEFATLSGPTLIGPRYLVKAETARVETENGAAHVHRAMLEELSPGTRYGYRVGGRGNWSRWSEFRTASARPEPFSFLYFGDVQDPGGAQWARLSREALRRNPDAAFMLYAGDMVNLRSKNPDSEWGTWYKSATGVQARVPTVPAIGGREYIEQWLGLRAHVAEHWTSQFALPRNGPPGLEDTVYYVDYQGLRIIALDSYHAIERDSVKEQAAWLRRVLEDSGDLWVIVTYHRPMFAMADGEEDPADLVEFWKPLFEEHGVDLVLQGHDHVYGRTATGDAPLGDGEAPVYVVSVAVPATSDLSDERAEQADRAGERQHFYQVVSVDRNRLVFETYTLEGERFDAFSLVRTEAGDTILLEPSS